MAGVTLTLTAQDLADLETGRELRRMLEGNFLAASHHACLTLIRQAAALEAEVAEYTETDVKIAGQLVGSWKIVVVKEGAGKEGSKLP